VDHVRVLIDVLLGRNEYPHGRIQSRTNNSAFSATPARHKIIQLGAPAYPTRLSLRQFRGPAIVVAMVCVCFVFTLLPEAQLLVEYWSTRAAARSRLGGNRHIIVANEAGVELTCRLPLTSGTDNCLGNFRLSVFSTCRRASRRTEECYAIVAG
jgi:hypothetical protein